MSKKTDSKDAPKLETIHEDRELSVPLMHSSQTRPESSDSRLAEDHNNTAYLSWISQVFPCLFEGEEDVCSFRL